jgi:transcriptional regulator with XRE-family HTH domain
VSAVGQGPDDLGTLLHSHRIVAGLSQEELARRSGLSVRAISNIERARTGSPYGRSIRLLAAALGLPRDAREELLRAASPDGRGRPPRAHAGPADADATMLRPVIVPGQLPAGVPGFVGRQSELRALADSLSGAANARTVLISAIGGKAGAGKTALALHWAHRVTGRFPDGQLHVDLRGSGAPDRAVDPADVIRGFLDALGVSAGRIPKGLENAAALYRSVLARRRLLVVLDNACDEHQVRPLLPGSPGSVALVTSRRQLTGLIAIEGARPITVDALSAAEARELLRRRLGSGRIAGEPGAVTELIDRCGRMPLALAVAAGRAAAHPALTLSALAAELRDVDASELGLRRALTGAASAHGWISAGSLPLSRLIAAP